ncbi:MAG: DUF2934 domain-containing protein [Blastocatellia bacterium]
MREKKKYDRSMDETPETRQSSTMMMEDRASTKAYRENGQTELRDLIARRAYEIYEERGRCDGEDMNDWLRAEAEVKSSLAPEKRRPMSSRLGARQ